MQLILRPHNNIPSGSSRDLAACTQLVVSISDRIALEKFTFIAEKRKERAIKLYGNFFPWILNADIKYSAIRWTTIEVIWKQEYFFLMLLRKRLASSVTAFNKLLEHILTVCSGRLSFPHCCVKKKSIQSLDYFSVPSNTKIWAGWIFIYKEDYFNYCIRMLVDLH